jgi:hypothetical protein
MANLGSAALTPVEILYLTLPIVLVIGGYVAVRINERQQHRKRHRPAE